MRLNLSSAVHSWAIRSGYEKAIDGSMAITYQELDRYADNISRTITRNVEGKDNLIAILAKNNSEFIIFLLGIIRTGNIFVLINPTLATEQINISLGKIDCKYYIASVENSAIKAKGIIIHDYKCCNLDCDNSFCPQFTGVQEKAGVIFSSGTTGQPKAILRTSYSFLSETIEWIIELQLQKGTSFLIPRPLFYTGGFVLLYSVLFSGGCVHLLDNISSKTVLNYASKVSLDWSFIVPAAIREMISLDDYSTISKSVLTMGSPILQGEKLAFHDKFGCRIIEAWGNSEGLGTITDFEDLFKKPNSIGRPFFSDFLDIEYYPNEKVGILFGLSDNEFSEYIGQQKLTNAVKHNNYIYSEDIGYKDSDGYFYITGREKEIIVINGIKVFPQDIEETLLSTGAIADCVVFGGKDNKGNDIVEAAIVMKTGFNAKDIITLVNSKLAPHEVIVSFIEMDYLPRNQGGKVDKTAIISKKQNIK